MKRLPKRSLSIVLFIVFLLVFVVYLVRNASEFALLSEVSPALLIGVAFGHMLGIVMNAVFLIEILRPLNRTLRLRESTYISLISAIGNYFTPFRGGAGVRAVYLKRRHGLSYTGFLSTFAGTLVLTSLITAAAGLVSLAFVSDRTDAGTIVWIGGFLLLVFLVSGWLAVFGVPGWTLGVERGRPAVGAVVQVLRGVSEGWSRIVSDRSLVFRLGVITSVNLALVVAVTLLEIAALGIEARLWGVVLYSALASLSLFLALTPGALGVRESVAILAASAIGLTTPEILSIAIIDRGVLFATLGLGWLMSPLLARASRIEAVGDGAELLEDASEEELVDGAGGITPSGGKE